MIILFVLAKKNETKRQFGGAQKQLNSYMVGKKVN